MKRAILIKSCQKNHARRVACESWAMAIFNASDIMPKFVVGGFNNGPFCGFATLGLNCGDEYVNNSFKLREAIQQLNGISEFTHVFICDDDTFIHPQRWLAHEPSGDFEGRLYQPDERESKSFGSDPWINGGAGWWMSRRMCELYVNECKERTSGDDVLASRIAQRHGIWINDRPDLYGDSRYSDSPKVAADNSLITCHPCNPQEMARLFESIK